ncbi:Endoglucanase [Quillaja saponaria]|uniref:Endoglucanase n=1 Tax=Quillaja saponaria TaxID=32244 RepID=A0AAD7QES4_QUISA|nr:Endoglucanase [Quillaja saponaria]
MSFTSLFSVCLIVLPCLFHGALSDHDYGTALTKSLLYYEAQRSGKLPSNQRVKWRGDSALNDGSGYGIDLVGGYYDAGDNVKFGFPMAFTVTMLSWSVVESYDQLKNKKELSNALAAIKWGTDYFIKAHPKPNVLYAQVGDGDSDHQCWERPEDMTTPRTVYKIDESHPGSDLAGETAAALAAASIAFKKSNPSYSSKLLHHAKQLFNFATSNKGKYSDSIPAAGSFYSSSGFEDELVWAAAWLYKASGDEDAQNYIGSNGNAGGVRTMFSWDDKYFGAQVLIAKFILDGQVQDNGIWDEYKKNAEGYICNVMGKGASNSQKTNAGLLWFSHWNNLQYVTASLLPVYSYVSHLAAKNSELTCAAQSNMSPNDLLQLAKAQVDYILGSNPQGRSYMVGFGNNFPQKVHHRGGSIVSIKVNQTPVGCQEGYSWYNSASPNPNVVDGAIVGGPDQSDNYDDSRSNYNQAEAATVNTAPLVGVLAQLAK